MSPHCLCWTALLLILAGCRASAPIHVWQPARLESAVGTRVAIPEVKGDEKVATAIHAKMLSLTPTDPGRKLIAVDPKLVPQPDAQPSQVIRLVSGTDDEASDLTLAAIARHESFDYIFSGRILSKNHAPADPAGSQTSLALSWRLLSVTDDRHAGGSPVVVNLDTAIDRYPDLAAVPDPIEALTIAAVRETYRLIAPAVTRDQVELAKPFGLPGSKQVRHGNTLAMAGRWGQAEAVWQSALDEHPSQVAALHNLALAAAAGQDFSRAKRLVRQAIRRYPAPLHQQTLVWIERRQREYHRAFGLADPPEGWFITRSE